MRKEKKKQAKNELDRLKQAEKKRRRLEKALATSAAIRSELEKKKEKKKEEQERLDEEGAAIAEAVALHVLLEEDADESCQIMLKNNKRFNSLDHSSNTGLFMGYQSIANNSAEGLGPLSASYGPWCSWSYLGSGRSLYPGMHSRDLQLPYYKNAGQGADISAGLLAAQAVSSLQIAENSQWDPIASHRAATVVIDRMFGGNALRDKANFYYDC
ncbi:hypothetical protein COCNU_07G008150 [Cocos nucifera]|uniref:Uncharacterized protein n=1 Tax=Cocos nucifera TaxID=13894 RepID=A0A8K0IGC1_COCNU|nr:hypothetical protein COCNU_07G008150 [Cocos nucifera]